jgi:transposase
VPQPTINYRARASIESRAHAHDYEPAAKRRLIEFCLQSGASVSGTALKAGINANQLRKWIRDYRDSVQARGALPAFVPVVQEVQDSRPIETLAKVAVPRHEAASATGDPPPRQAQPLALLSAKLPNGVSLELECSERDVGLVKAMIEALSGDR